jgi:hypothetical protein
LTTPRPTSSPDLAFDIHGLALAVSCSERSVEDAIRARLGRFPVATCGEGALTFVCDDGPLAPVRGEGGRGRVVGRLGPGGAVVYRDGPDRLTVELGGRSAMECDAHTGRAAVSAEVVGPDPAWMVSRPLLSLALHELMKRRGRYPLHAAGLVRGDQMLLLAGVSGCGKSTLSAALVARGLGYAGDDTQFLVRRGDHLDALAFPEDIDLARRSLELLPGLAGMASAPAPGAWKLTVAPERVPASRLAWRARPAVLVFPTVGAAGPSVLEPMDGGDALVALATNVILTEPESSQAHLDVIAELVRQCRCRRLRTGSDLASAAGLLAGLLD